LNTKFNERLEIKNNDEFADKYNITIGIVLSGVLALYLIFIGIQLKTLFLGTLPVDFEETVNIVKSGFWQLFMLTIINILFYIGLYQKSTKIVQRILSFFTFASLLLILSAAYRTYLYVVTYGLSYEKFYAFFTVIFCMGVFVWFLYLDIWKKQKPEIVRNLAFASLWMYALTTIVPLERLIFSTNLALTQEADSRVNINELKMLGFDTLPVVEKHFEKLIVEAEKDNDQQIKKDLSEAEFELPAESELPAEFKFPEEVKNEWLTRDINTEWKSWVNETRSQSEIINYSNYTYDYYGKGVPMKQLKRWYEKTISELIY